MEFTKKDTYSNWSRLPKDLLRLIAERLPIIEDFVRFGAVCQSWRLVTVEKHYYLTLARGLPWLILFEEKNKSDSTWGFFSFSCEKVYKLKLPDARRKICWGSPYGWLITFDPLNTMVHLLNPLSRHQIPLPPIYSKVKVKRYHFYDRSVISSNPSTTVGGDCIVMGMLDNYLAFAKPGDRAWTPIQSTQAYFNDIIYLDDQFYAIDEGGILVVCELGGPQPKTAFFASPPMTQLKLHSGTAKHLVDSLREMYVVLHDLSLKEYTENLREITIPEVYKLDLCSRNWVRVTSLEGRAFFIGNNSSFSVSASDYPECRKNCIYFAYNTKNGVCIEAFNLENNTAETTCIGKYGSSCFRCLAWMIPNLW